MRYMYIYVKIKDIAQRFRKFHRDMWKASGKINL